jgi:hypothetical protein
MIAKKVFNWAVELLSSHNDGWTKKKAKEKLTEISKCTKAEAEELIFIYKILSLNEPSLGP